jgi:hypothetical protein
VQLGNASVILQRLQRGCTPVLYLGNPLDGSEGEVAAGSRRMCPYIRAVQPHQAFVTNFRFVFRRYFSDLPTTLTEYSWFLELPG